MPESDKVLLFLLRMSGLEMGWLRYFFAALNATAISRVALEGFFKVGNMVYPRVQIQLGKSISTWRFYLYFQINKVAGQKFFISLIFTIFYYVLRNG